MKDLVGVGLPGWYTLGFSVEFFFCTMGVGNLPDRD